MMKKMKTLMITGMTVLTLVAGSVTAFAASQYQTPAEAVAGLTGREVQTVIDERSQTGKTYGTIAKEAGVLDQFKAEMLEMKKETLAQRVAAGTMTQEQADAIIAQMEENMANCDGLATGRGQNGKGLGVGFGQGNGHGCGQGNGQGRGQHGAGMGNGQGRGQNGAGMGNGQGRGRHGAGMGNGLGSACCGQ